jgi:hypothetical protein
MAKNAIANQSQQILGKCCMRATFAIRTAITQRSRTLAERELVGLRRLSPISKPAGADENGSRQTGVRPYDHCQRRRASDDELINGVTMTAVLRCTVHQPFA